MWWWRPICSAISSPTSGRPAPGRSDCAVGQPEPGRRFPSLFEPVHGSAPDISGQNIANPIAMIWSGAMMLDFLGNGDERYRAAHDGILRGIEAVIAEGMVTPI